MVAAELATAVVESTAAAMIATVAAVIATAVAVIATAAAAVATAAAAFVGYSSYHIRHWCCRVAAGDTVAAVLGSNDDRGCRMAVAVATVTFVADGSNNRWQR